MFDASLSGVPVTITAGFENIPTSSSTTVRSSSSTGGGVAAARATGAGVMIAAAGLVGFAGGVVLL
jgi:hypothetical protein